MNVLFVNRKRIESEYSLRGRLKRKIKYIKSEFKNNRKEFLYNLLKFRLPKRKNLIGLFNPPDRLINVETIYWKYSHSDTTFINKVTEVDTHEVLHALFYPLKKEFYFDAGGEEWIIKKMGY